MLWLQHSQETEPEICRKITQIWQCTYYVKENNIYTWNSLGRSDFFWTKLKIHAICCLKKHKGVHNLVWRYSVDSVDTTDEHALEERSFTPAALCSKFPSFLIRVVRSFVNISWVATRSYSENPRYLPCCCQRRVIYSSPEVNISLKSSATKGDKSFIEEGRVTALRPLINFRAWWTKQTSQHICVCNKIDIVHFMTKLWLYYINI